MSTPCLGRVWNTFASCSTLVCSTLLLFFSDSAANALPVPCQLRPCSFPARPLPSRAPSLRRPCSDVAKALSPFFPALATNVLPVPCQLRPCAAPVRTWQQPCFLFSQPLQLACVLFHASPVPVRSLLPPGPWVLHPCAILVCVVATSCEE